jgi:hypothetical protein
VSEFQVFLHSKTIRSQQPGNKLLHTCNMSSFLINSHMISSTVAAVAAATASSSSYVPDFICIPTSVFVGCGLHQHCGTVSSEHDASRHLDAATRIAGCSWDDRVGICTTTTAATAVATATQRFAKGADRVVPCVHLRRRHS